MSNDKKPPYVEIEDCQLKHEVVDQVTAELKNTTGKIESVVYEAMREFGKMTQQIKQLTKEVEALKVKDSQQDLEIEKVKEFDGRVLNGINTIKILVYVAVAVVTFSQFYQLFVD